MKTIISLLLLLSLTSCTLCNYQAAEKTKECKCICETKKQQCFPKKLEK